jgi:hypothetical protein
MGKLARAIFPVHQPMMMHLTMVKFPSRPQSLRAPETADRDVIL